MFLYPNTIYILAISFFRPFVGYLEYFFLDLMGYLNSKPNSYNYYEHIVFWPIAGRIISEKHKVYNKSIRTHNTTQYKESVKNFKSIIFR